jgi:hypothetical protein
VTGALAARARECGVRQAHVSLSHQEGFAAAVVILEGVPRRAMEAPATFEIASSGTW